MKRTRLVTSMQSTVGAIAVAVLGIGLSQADVSLKNGNYSTSFVDVIKKSGLELKIERVYNAKTDYVGIFGQKWGYESGAYVKQFPDASVVVYEYGGGAQNRFYPVKFQKNELTQAVETIATAARSMGQYSTKQQMDQYRDKLEKDAAFRSDEWERLLKVGKVKEQPIPLGAQLVSNRFSFQYMTRTKDGFVRTFENGKMETFNEAGKLAKVQDRNGNTMTYTYGKDGHVAKIEDNYNQKLMFTFNQQGLVERITDESGRTAQYRYNAAKQMTFSKDVDANEYSYEYTTDGRNLLTAIGYSDKTKLQIAYYPPAQLDSVKQIKNRDGSMTDYAYTENAGVADHFTVSITERNREGKELSKSSYEYFIQHKVTGEEWTQRLVATIDGDQTDTTYNICCGLPVEIKKNGAATQFVYDVKGRVTQKTTPSEVTVIKYDPKANKIARVENLDRKTKKTLGWSEFRYDARSNLTFARSNEGKAVQLFYDRSGRIASMIDHQKRRINFRYNEQSKPIEIADPSVGSLKIEYNSSGEVKRVDNPGNRKIAVHVSTLFGDFMSIVRRAGVNFDFGF